jgi:localization factor PodJL
LANPPVIPDPAGQSDFIAAARRAAKAAEQAPGPPIPLQAQRLDPVLDAAPGDNELPHSAFGAARPSLLGVVRSKLKSLLIASSVVAIVVGGYYLISSALDGKTASPTPGELLHGKPAGSSTLKPANPPPPGLYEDLEPELENPPAQNPASDAGSNYKLLAPDSTLHNAPGLAPEPARPDSKPEDKPDVTGSIGRGAARAVYADKLPAGIGGPGLREAALRGEAGAAYEIAIRYADGQGVARSTEDAARWFERAAARGVAPAQFRLGSLYEKGTGVRRDLKEARRLYSAAAAQGHAKAMHNLAVLYAEGIDGKPDYKTAAQWFQKAAGYGVSDSQYNLGILHARGLGIEKNLPDSYKWFSLAAAQGDKEAARKRDDIGVRLDAAARAAAETAVKTWVPQLQPQQAIRVPAPAGGWDRQADGVAVKESDGGARETPKEAARAARPRTAAAHQAPMQIGVR